MKKFTVSDLATILQLDQSVKQDLVSNFDSYENELKYEILEILWNGLNDLKKRLAKLKYDQFLDEVNTGKRKLTNSLYDEATKAVWKDFEDISSGKKQDISQIEEIRANLQPLLTSDHLSPTPPVQKA